MPGKYGRSVFDTSKWKKLLDEAQVKDSLTIKKRTEGAEDVGAQPLHEVMEASGYDEEED
jgi:hypothetical protein